MSLTGQVIGSSPGVSSGLTPETYSDSIIINQNQEYTATRQVQLSLKADNASQMVICNNLYFTACSLEPYQETKAWTLTEGQGRKTVYALFASSAGNKSLIISDSIIFEVETEEVTGTPAGVGPIETEEATEEAPEPSETEVGAEPFVPLLSREEAIQQLRVQIIVIRQKLIEMIIQLIQLIQQRMAGI